VGGKARRTKLSDGIVDTLRAIAAMLETRPLRCAVIGGIAVIARGVPRLTRDVDLVVEGPSIDAASLAGELERAGILPRIPNVVAFASESLVLLMRHARSGVDVDVSLGWLPFELEAIGNASPAFIADVRLPVARAEDLVIFKAVAWRPQDQQDAERLLALHAGTLDLARIRRHVAELARALEVDRSADLESLIERAGG
jgi:hypothetical protein